LRYLQIVNEGYNGGRRMIIMSQAILELTVKSIDNGYRNHNESVIEKETDYVLGKIITSLLSIFPDKLTGITLDKFGIAFNKRYLISEAHKKHLMKWLDRLTAMEHPSSVAEFGKLKIDFQTWYYKMGGESINFLYHDSYLLTTSEAAEALGVSKVTVNKYIKQGLECVDTTSHRKIPKHAVEVWKDPVYAIKMQMIAQEKMRLEQTPEERLLEIGAEISRLQFKYKALTVAEAFKEYDGDEMDDPTDYYLWRDLEEEQEELIRESGGQKCE
jgi:excisionase family DNA binding protein